MQLESQCEQLQLKVRTLQLDWETEQKRSVSYFNQIMELEKERDQVSMSGASESSLDPNTVSNQFTKCIKAHLFCS